MECCLLCRSFFLALLWPGNKGQRGGLSPEAALTAPSSHLKLVPGVRQLGGNSPKLGMLGRQNLGILLQLFRRALDVRDHTCMHVNAHSCLHVCTHAHSYTELKKHGHGYIQQKQVRVTSGHFSGLESCCETCAHHHSVGLPCSC